MIENISEEEVKEIKVWRSENEENEGLYNRIVESERIKKSFHVYDQIDVDAAFLNIIPQKGKVIGLIPNWLKYSVAAIILIASGLFYINFDMHDETLVTQSHITKQNAKGVKSHIKLPDGTSVWLNAASHISYPQGFTATQRLVQLEGEAYFDVVKDKTRPFIVTSGNVVTTALGTSFNIKAIDTQNIEVSLNTGKVNVARIDNNEQVILQPGQQAKLDGLGLLVSEFKNEIVLAWKEGTIIFDNTDFDEMISVLEKWYDVSFVIENLSQQERQSIKVIGEFENQTLENVLKLLSHSMHFKYTINKKIVTLKF